MQAPYKLLVFDWDGTLMDSEAKIIACVDAATDELRSPRVNPDRIRNIIGLGLPEAMNSLFPERSERFRVRFVERYRHYFMEGNGLSSELFPGVQPTLQSLKEEGYLLGVATGKSRMGLERDFGVTGLGAVFDVTRCADETSSKPNPRMLEEIMDELAVVPEQTVMIGDTEYDLAMANKAGTHAVAVAYGVHGRDRLLKFNPCVCLDSITDLLEWLKKVGKIEATDT